MSRTPLLLLLAFLLTGLSGCLSDDGNDTMDDEVPDDGDGDQGISAPEPVTIEVALTGAYPLTIAYNPETITVLAGQEVTIRFTNNDQNPVPNHDWVLEGYEATASTAVAGNGETVEVTFTAPSEAGDYTFYCSIPGHRDAGMEGTLTVATP